VSFVFIATAFFGRRLSCLPYRTHKGKENKNWGKTKKNMM